MPGGKLWIWTARIHTVYVWPSSVEPGCVYLTERTPQTRYFEERLREFRITQPIGTDGGLRRVYISWRAILVHRAPSTQRVHAQTPPVATRRHPQTHKLIGCRDERTLRWSPRIEGGITSAVPSEQRTADRQALASKVYSRHPLRARVITRGILLELL